ncbi:PAS domain S-box protein [Candidatus Fermentibacteria bacterium]|nr:PAS domain S-box protein [Candidatus Fermentibacteria bacterium]
MNDSDRSKMAEVQDCTISILHSCLEYSSIEEIYGAIHQAISRLFFADNFYIALYDQRSGMINFPYFVDSRDESPQPRPFGKGLTEKVISTESVLLITRKDMEQMIERGEMELIGKFSRWWLGVPLRVRNKVFGVLAIQSYGEGPPLSHEERQTLKMLAEAASVVIEKERSAQELRKSEELYRMVVSNAEDGIVLVKNGKLELANPQVCKMTGWEEEEAIGRDITDFFVPEQREIVEERNRRRLQGEDLSNIFETELLHKDGHRIPVEISSNPVSMDDSLEIMAIVRDLTARKRAEEERRTFERRLQHAQKLESLGVLAGGVAHDFNNLLMGILGNAGLALMEVGPDNPAHKTIERLEKAALRAAELTNQLLAYSGKGKFVVEPLDLNDMVREMANLLEAAVSSNVLLRLDLGEDSPAVEADHTQIRQVLMNLIMNASEAVGETSGAVTISTGVSHLDRDYFRGTYLESDLEEGNYAYLEVSDTGCGMSSEEVIRIFDPFYSTKFTGRGLGLAAVVGIVKGHGGTIKVYSEPGEGSTFKVLLPLVGSTVRKREKAEEDAEAGMELGEHAPTVLIVDDEENSRTVPKLILEKAGCTVLLAEDGLEAVEVFDEQGNSIDLVLLDMTMPRMSGRETLTELRKLDSSIGIVLTSGYSKRDAISRFGSSEISGFIQKPYTPGDLISLIVDMMQQEPSEKDGGEESR